MRFADHDRNESIILHGNGVRLTNVENLTEVGFALGRLLCALPKRVISIN